MNSIRSSSLSAHRTEYPEEPKLPLEMIALIIANVDKADNQTLSHLAQTCKDLWQLASVDTLSSFFYAGHDAYERGDNPKKATVFCVLADWIVTVAHQLPDESRREMLLKLSKLAKIDGLDAAKVDMMVDTLDRFCPLFRQEIYPGFYPPHNNEFANRPPLSDQEWDEHMYWTHWLGAAYNDYKDLQEIAFLRSPGHSHLKALLEPDPAASPSVAAHPTGETDLTELPDAEIATLLSRIDKADHSVLLRLAQGMKGRWHLANVDTLCAFFDASLQALERGGSTEKAHVYGMLADWIVTVADRLPETTRHEMLCQLSHRAMILFLPDSELGNMIESVKKVLDLASRQAASGVGLVFGLQWLMRALTQYSESFGRLVIKLRQREEQYIRKHT